MKLQKTPIVDFEVESLEDLFNLKQNLLILGISLWSDKLLTGEINV